MKKIVMAALVALPLFAVSARAQCIGGGCGSFRVGVNLGVNWSYGSGPGGGCCPGGGPCGGGLGIPGGAVGQLAPWYLYWPLEAEYQTPAPTGYPYWPSPMTIPTGAAYGAPAPGNFMPALLQPAGYAASPPGYWSR